MFGGMADHKFEAINETRILSPDESEEVIAAQLKDAYQKVADEVFGVNSVTISADRADSGVDFKRKPVLPFIDEEAIMDKVSTYVSPNKDEPVVLGYRTGAPRDNFERAAQAREGRKP